MNKVTLTIDGKTCEAQEGEFILNVARANSTFIPAICYLTRCSPTLACRICLVEANGKQVYACNTKVKEGMEVTTSTETIEEEKKAIMEVYDVNHPLQCGVCDQSGECELQNYTLEVEVDKQNYAIPDTKRETTNWSSVLHYDSGLCIVCERCTTVCKDMIGDSAIKTVPRGGESLDKSYKDSMPKDAYSMWNKLQKSVIAPSNGTGETNCSDCGECIAVCPVGALVSRDFVYKSNAWDLNKVPATCAHCSSGCQIYYETKETSIKDREEKIYRVTNEWNYISLCGAGRFGYDFENKNIEKNQDSFDKAVESFKIAKNVKFNSTITNEEALILQKLKDKLKFNLVNEEVINFQKFLKNYKKYSGNSLYTTDCKEILNSDFVISVGTSLINDNPNARYSFNSVQKMNKGAGLYFHPIQDKIVETFGKNVSIFNHKVNQEEAVLYLILDLFSDKKLLPKNTQDYLNSFHSSEEKIVKEKVEKTVKEIIKDKETGEEKEVSKKIKETVDKKITIEVNELVNLVGGDDSKFKDNFTKMMKKKSNFSMIIGEDLYFHKNSENIVKLLALIEKTSSIKIAMIPPKSNSLGVALLCDLDEEEDGFTVGYNESGDFKISALGNGDLDIPALNQQEGTLTNMYKRVVPTNAALEYNGYELNDIANYILDNKTEKTVDWTEQLPLNKGFQKIKFDDLPNGYKNDGTENRGYLLKDMFDEVKEFEVDNFENIITLSSIEFIKLIDKKHKIKIIDNYHINFPKDDSDEDYANHFIINNILDNLKINKEIIKDKPTAYDRLVEIFKKTEEIYIEGKPKDTKLNLIEESATIYRCNPQRQFNDFTNKSNQIFEEFGAYASSKKAEELGDKIQIVFDKDNILEVDIFIDDRMNGDIIKIPDFDSSKNIYSLFKNDRFKTIEVRKV